MNKITKPLLKDIPKFRNAKLGTLWKHKSGKIARLRRANQPSDPTIGWLYLMEINKSKTYRRVIPEHWEEYTGTV